MDDFISFPPGLLIEHSRRKGGVTYHAYPNISAIRWLLPKERSSRKRGLVMYSPQTLAGQLKKKLIDSGVLSGERVVFDKDKFDLFENRIARALGEKKLLFSFDLGVSGVYRKTKFQVVDRTGKIIAYGKSANKDGAIRCLENEKKTLEYLRGIEPLEKKVPSIINLLEFDDNKCLLITAGPEKNSSLDFGEMHRRFILHLYQNTEKLVKFTESTMFKRMKTRDQFIKRRAVHSSLREFSKAIHLIEAALASERISMPMAHGDFVPWNIKLGEEDLFVFDWESAEQEMIPLYDVFHFFVIQAALLRKPFCWKKNKVIDDMMDSIKLENEHLRKVFYLSYLVDIGQYYAVANIEEGDIGDRRIVKWVKRELRKVME